MGAIHQSAWEARHSPAGLLSCSGELRGVQEVLLLLWDMAVAGHVQRWEGLTRECVHWCRSL